MSFNRKTDKSIVAVEYYTAVKMNKLECISTWIKLIKCWAEKTKLYQDT